MTSNWKRRIEEIVIYLVEKGENTQREIAETCKVNISTVRKIINNYDAFYTKIFQNKK